MDRGAGYSLVRCDWFCGRLLQAGETQKSGTNRKTEAPGPIVDCHRGVGGPLCVNQVLRQRILLEREYSVCQSYIESDGH
jgi:hypothetical protein